MKVLEGRRLFLLGGIVLAITAGAVATTVLRASATTQYPTISSQAAHYLAATGFTVADPTGAPSVDQASAERAAIAANPGSRVINSGLVTVVQGDSSLVNDHLMWVVSIVPPAGLAPGGHGPMAATWDYVLVDAATGQAVETRALGAS
jgi:hypothetical protein